MHDIGLQYDEEMLAQIMEADAADEVLRYVGVVNIQEQKCDVALKRSLPISHISLRELCLLCRYPRQHALSGLNGTDNMVIFRTARYNEQPLVIQGPGAGAEVTAMGVFSDVLTIAKRLKD